MGPKLARLAALALLLGAAGSGVLAAVPQNPLQTDARSMERKLTTILARGLTAPKNAAATRTSISEREINAYLKVNAKDSLPKGIVNPELTLMGDRRVAGNALVNLDTVRQAKPRGWLDPAAYLTGTVEVHASGVFDARDGKGIIQIESATLGGVPVPNSLLQELVSYYSRSAELPGGFALDQPFELPAHIREVEIQRGAATIVQ
jgi:hypothetical protein